MDVLDRWHTLLGIEPRYLSVLRLEVQVLGVILALGLVAGLVLAVIEQRKATRRRAAENHAAIEQFLCDDSCWTGGPERYLPARRRYLELEVVHDFTAPRQVAHS